MGSKKQKKGDPSPAYAAVHAFALSFPEAYEEFPWGHSAIKVRKKIFVSMGETDEGFSMSLKLGESNFEALLLPFTEPTHYGMGKHGWVTSRFAPGARPPMPLVQAWIEESYRAIAPKGLVAELDAAGTGKAAARKTSTRKPAARKKAGARTKKKPAATKKKAASTTQAASKKKAAEKPSSRKKRPPRTGS